MSVLSIEAEQSPSILIPTQEGSEYSEVSDQLAESILEDLLKDSLKIIDTIDYVLEHLGQIVNNNELRLANKREVCQKIKHLRTIISIIKKSPFIVVKKKNIKSLLLVMRQLIDHIQLAIQTGLQKIPSFDFDFEQTKGQLEEPISLDELAKQLYEIKQAVVNLEKKAGDVGLSWANKGYRKLEQVNRDYKILPWLGKTALLGLGAVFLISRIDKKYFEIPFLGAVLTPVKSWAGHKTEYNLKTGKLVNAPDEIGIVTHVEHILGVRRLGILNLDITPIITMGLLAVPFAEHTKQFYRWGCTKLSTFGNFLRGGPIKRKGGVWEKEPKVTFNDIIGQEHHKEVLSRIVEYIKDHQKFDRAGIAPERGYLLAGPPRTGKTFIAEALAGEIKHALKDSGESYDFRFLAFTAADIQKHGAEMILDVAQSLAPCVLFIDEIDMLGLQRERDAKMLSEFLTAMSGCLTKEKEKQVIILAATNKPENLDEALRKHGRFGKLLRFELPCTEDRKTYIIRQLEKRAIMLEESFIDKLAYETEHCSFDDLHAIITNALQKAKIKGEAVTEQDLEEAFDEEIRNILLQDIALSEVDKQLVATHQAGHALANILLQPEHALVKVTIRPVTATIQEEHVWKKYWDENYNQQEAITYGSIFTKSNGNTATFDTREELMKQCKIHLAGYVAEQLLFGSSGYTYHKQDRSQALAIAKYIIFKGMDANQMPKDMKEQLLHEAHKLMNLCEEEVGQLLKQYQESLSSIIESLLKKHTLLAEEIEQMIQT